jgi:hypothetical protein
LFNPSQPQYVAVVGPQNLEVIVLEKNGRVDYKVKVDLMLEEIDQDLTIVNVKWLPNSPTSIAIATKDFVKIYDMGADLMSPTHNIMIFDGFITDFDFSKPREL